MTIFPKLERTPLKNLNLRYINRVVVTSSQNAAYTRLSSYCFLLNRTFISPGVWLDWEANVITQYYKLHRTGVYPWRY
jgi:hypothetical protein